MDSTFRRRAPGASHHGACGQLPHAPACREWKFSPLRNDGALSAGVDPVSLYLHYHRKVETHLDDELVEYVQGLFTTCEGLVRGSNGTGCDGQLFSWYSGGAPAMPDKCESFVSFFTHSSHLLLLNERYEESIWLLYQMLGWGSPPALVHLNARPDAIYDQQVTLRTTSGIDAILAESCLPDIYAAARERFEHVYRLARAYCTNREPCDLATSQLGLSLWKPLQRQ